MFRGPKSAFRTAVAAIAATLALQLLVIAGASCWRTLYFYAHPVQWRFPNADFAARWIHLHDEVLVDWGTLLITVKRDGSDLAPTGPAGGDYPSCDDHDHRGLDIAGLRVCSILCDAVRGDRVVRNTLAAELVRQTELTLPLWLPIVLLAALAVVAWLSPSQRPGTAAESDDRMQLYSRHWVAIVILIELVTMYPVSYVRGIGISSGLRPDDFSIRSMLLNKRVLFELGSLRLDLRFEGDPQSIPGTTKLRRCEDAFAGKQLLGLGATFHYCRQRTFGGGVDPVDQKPIPTVLRELQVKAPIWALMVPFGAPIGAHWFRQRRRIRWQRDGRCPACGYDLASGGLDRCPECGKSETR